MRGDKSLLIFFAIACLGGLLLNNATLQTKVIALLILLLVAFSYYWRKDAREINRLTAELDKLKSERHDR